MNENGLKRLQQELPAKIQEWLKESGIVLTEERLVVTVQVVPTPTIEINMVSGTQILGSIEDRCAIKIKDLNISGHLLVFIQGFITLGQLTRFTEDELRTHTGSHTFKKIGATTINRIRELLTENSLGFNSRLPMGDKERNIILDPSPDECIDGGMIRFIVRDAYPTIRSLTEDTQQQFLRKVSSVIALKQNYKDVPATDVLNEATAILKQFNLSLKPE